MSSAPLFDTIATFFNEIASAFGAADLPRFRQLYALPCMVLTPQGAQPLMTESDFEALFTPMLQRLRAQHFARSAFARLTVKQLGPTIALAAMHWTRYRADGSVLETLGATYTLVLGDGRWRIMALIGHGPDCVPTLS